WGKPQNLDCTVNSDKDDFGPNYLEVTAGGMGRQTPTLELPKLGVGFRGPELYTLWERRAIRVWR
ncbi:MAG TPA: hypothetical protein VGL72_00810, partial [Bryobacteraceae bacterium]